jgi:flagellar motility protein MotE (MotC chaperone)
LAYEVLSGAPGPVGKYFDSFPTEDEKSMQIEQIANYILDIDKSRGIDKLIAIESKDGAVYDSVIKSMLRIDPNNTKDILEEIRKKSLKKDVVISTLEEIDGEKNQELIEQGAYMDSLGVVSAVEEIKKIIEDNISGYKMAADILANMTTDKASKIIGQLSQDDQDKLLFYIPQEKRSEIRETTSSRVRKFKDVESASELLQTEKIDKLVETIGNTNTYSIEELGIIYKNLGIIKAGKVLSKVQDDQFIYSLIEKMKENEILNEGNDFITSDILKSIKIYRQFDDNVNELTKVYLKMGDDKIADIIRRLIRNSSEPQVYRLDSGEFITITDEDLALSLLDNFSEKKVASILSYLDNNLSKDISKKLAFPID